MTDTAFWTQLKDGSTWNLPDQPPGQVNSGFVYFPDQGNSVLIGGQDTEGGAPYWQTWTWDGTDWTHESPAHTPPPAYSRTPTGTENSNWFPKGQVWMGYHSYSAKLVLHLDNSYLQFPSGTTYHDYWTYTWDGADWAQETPAHSPLAADHASVVMAEADIGGDLIMVTFDGAVVKTWAWRSGDWVSLSPATTPGGYITAMSNMGYDQNNGEVVAYDPLNDKTWLYNGNDWSNPTTTNSPFTLLGNTVEWPAPLAWDSFRNKVVMYVVSAIPQEKTFAWDSDNQDWIDLKTTTTPGDRTFGAMTADPPTGKAIWFGGSIGPALQGTFRLDGCITPTASFYYTLSGTTVSFFDTSVGTVTSWLWDFGDGNTSPDQNPVHDFGDNRCHTVELTVNSPCGSDTTIQGVNSDGYDGVFGGSAGGVAVGSPVFANDPSAGWGPTDATMTTYQGVPVISWIEFLSPNSGGPYVAIWNTGSGDWGTIMDPVGSTGGALRETPLLATDGTNLYLAYSLTTGSDTGQIEVYKYNGSSWARLGNVSPGWFFEVGADYRPQFSLCADPGEVGACYVMVNDSADSGGTTNRLVVRGFGTSTLSETTIDTGPGNSFSGDIDNAGGHLAVYYTNTDGSQIQVWTRGSTGNISISNFHQKAFGSPVTWAAFSDINLTSGADGNRYLAVSISEGPVGSSPMAVAFTKIDPTDPYVVLGIDCNSSQTFQDSTEVIYVQSFPQQFFYAAKVLIEDRGFWMQLRHLSGGDRWLVQLDRHCACVAGQWPTWRDPGNSFGNSAPFTFGGGYNVLADAVALDGIWAYSGRSGGGGFAAAAIKHPIIRNSWPCQGCTPTITPPVPETLDSPDPMFVISLNQVE